MDVVEDAEGNPKVTITNTRQTGSLTIEKAIAGDILADEASKAMQRSSPTPSRWRPAMTPRLMWLVRPSAT